MQGLSMKDVFVYVLNKQYMDIGPKQWVFRQLFGDKSFTLKGKSGAKGKLEGANRFLQTAPGINSIIFYCVKHRADGKCQIYLVKGYTNVLDSCDANLILECDSREVDNILADRLVLCKLVSTRVGKVNVFLALNYEAGEHHPGIPYISWGLPITMVDMAKIKVRAIAENNGDSEIYEIYYEDEENGHLYFALPPATTSYLQISPMQALRSSKFPLPTY